MHCRKVAMTVAEHKRGWMSKKNKERWLGMMRNVKEHDPSVHLLIHIRDR